MITSNNILSVSEVNPPVSFNGIMKDVKIIRVVTALPSVIEPNVTYLVGAQNSINITGLNGNANRLYSISLKVINPAGSDSLSMRFNGVSTNVYDYRYGYAGTASTAAANAQNLMVIAPSTGGNSINESDLTIMPLTGVNRGFSARNTQGGSSQKLVAGVLVSGGNWRDNSTNLTSIQLLYPTINGGFGVGTEIHIFALQSI